MNKKIFSILLSMILMVSMLSVPAFAEPDEEFNSSPTVNTETDNDEGLAGSGTGNRIILRSTIMTMHLRVLSISKAKMISRKLKSLLTLFLQNLALLSRLLLRSRFLSRQRLFSWLKASKTMTGMASMI